MTARLRLRVAWQCFKRALLGDAHNPRRPQIELIARTLNARGIELAGRISRNTLMNWWLQSGQRANEQSCAAFDKVSVAALRFTRHSNGEQLAPDPQFFSALMRGGLLRAIAEAAGPAGEYERLLAPARAYLPVGSLHLQMDAVDAMRLDFGFGSWPMASVKNVMATKVLRCLHLKWSPRWALAYGDLSSPTRGRWLAASPAERVQLECRDQPWLAQHLARERTRGGSPDWSVIPVGHDAQPNQVLLTMVALAADHAFWEEDRLRAWAWDLGTATLATGAEMWSDRQAQFNLAPVSDTMVVWYTMMKWLFLTDDEPDASDFEEVCKCLRLSGEGPAQALLRARKSYRAELASLGLEATQLGAVDWRGEDAGVDSAAAPLAGRERKARDPSTSGGVNGTS